MYYGKMVDLIDLKVNVEYECEDMDTVKITEITTMRGKKIPLDLIDEKNMKYLKAAAIVDAIDNGKREQEQIEIDKYESRREYGL